MTIYEIDQRLLDCVDEETGEILDIETFKALAMEKEQKVENMALWAKDLKAEAEAIGKEINALTKRKQAAENKVERLKAYIATILEGHKFKTPRCSIYYMTSNPTEILDEKCFIDWAKENGQKFLSYPEPKISLTAVKEALNKGEKIPYASIGEKTSTVIR